MIYADPSFLFSFYAWDEHSEAAARAYQHDARRPLFLTPWQRFETRNAVRLAVHRFKRARLAVPFQAGNVYRDMQEDLDCGRLRHAEVDWRDSMRLADEISAAFTESVGAASVDVWHVAAAALLQADTFWTFNEAQRQMAQDCAKFRRVPNLL